MTGGERRPLTVVHALRTADPAGGGVVTYVERLREAFAGHSVALRIESVFPRAGNWRVVALRRPWRFLARVRRRLRDADLLHVHGVFGWHVLLSVRAAAALGRPYALTAHGHLHPEALRERRLAKRGYLALAGRRILENASVVLASVPAERDLLQRHAPRARVELLMPGLPVSEALPRTRTDAPETAGRGPLNVLYLGRLHPHKGLHLAVEALAAVRADNLDAVLTVAGSGRPRYRRAVVRLAERLGVVDQVAFVGHIGAEERTRLLADADLLVLPSRSENFGFSAAEAMAAGLPVVVTESVGLASLVRDRRCGRIVPAGSVAAMERALLAYADPVRRREDGRRAHAAAREAFSIPEMAAALAAIYRAIVPASGP